MSDKEEYNIDWDSITSTEGDFTNAQASDQQISDMVSLERINTADRPFTFVDNAKRPEFDFDIKASFSINRVISFSLDMFDFTYGPSGARVGTNGELYYLCCA